jgi:26S proteasome regulatory subunit N7
MFIREIKAAGKLFIETIMTFTCTELFDYKKFIFYTIVTNIFHLERSSLNSKILESPDVLSCINEIPNMFDFLNSFYTGNYRKFIEMFCKFYFKN